ncbi:MAG: hypothetical protein JJE01_01225 [Gemmatimonadetes bacterium]|nr:hypothetical protein [Gemmatimonadota bacterium]
MANQLNRDFLDMLSALSAEGAEFLVVGAYALAAYGLPRATGDLDIWINRAPANVERVWRALSHFGAPLDDLAPGDLEKSDLVLQIGVAPQRIDLLTSIDGLEFAAAWPDRVETEVAGMRVPVISRAHLVRNKRASGRPQDIADVAWLEENGA